MALGKHGDDFKFIAQGEEGFNIIPGDIDHEVGCHPVSVESGWVVWDGNF
jgi:hypothetical protein